MRRNRDVSTSILNPLAVFAAVVSALVFTLGLSGCSLELPGPDQGAPAPPSGLAADVSFDTGTDAEPDQEDDGTSDGEDDMDPGDTQEDGEVGPTYESCVDVKTQNPNAGSGVYTMDFDGNIVDVYCEMTPTGEWMLAGVITNQSDDFWSPDANPNWWEATDLPEQGTLDPNANADYRSPAWHLYGASELRITFNGEFLIRSNGCTGGQSLADFFSGLSWSCGVIDPLANCSQQCPLTSQNSSFDNEEALIGQSDRTTIYMKAGNGDDDLTGEQERVYISTDRRSVNESQGLGVRCENICGGNAGATDVGDAGLANAGIAPAPDSGRYGIWVR